ncbi:hypothetical protein A2524_01150 [Candidatus Wolfebacteria bacterium RIFOXYD12_FULL_48_21]|uniref:Peptidase S11 D-alanyl-D-alanine carboxypeptidase A N-terminal domain-containing protein n=1 Tax=Candidatus Wolfebacteria bacterium RIFOXYD1_FULL_48_65 TaxID=1802561 RepID=A0A1F8E0C7_9BACT|nr:MAG: hypothetical protein A2610_03095 [Candidatus Wolfebacteria bacterium RIFOXYD1_FULL_48_65]OGM94416.1 MAG: hypothetical protein A2524_01150 [Candidatus Wolfebacteria bacterium RIFOXYD12_FULL_48_21]
MRKSRIILLILFISLSFAVFKAMGEEGNHYIVDQTAVVKDSISDAGSNWSPIIVTEGVAPELAAQGAFVSPVAADIDQPCGAGVGMREGLMSYLNSDEVLFERKTDGRWPIASITKLMTAIVATELGMAKQDFTLTDAMVKTEGDAGGFKMGELFTGYDLLAAMLLSSSNDAAEAFAQSYGRDAFIRRMNVKAQELRMLSTHYVDPSGLSPLNQSTPSDLYKLAGYLHATHPDILKVSRQRKATIVDLNTNRKRIVTTINEFAGQATFLGGKTGYIVEAEGNGNLLSVFMHNGQPFTLIVLGSPDRFGETKTLLKCI